MAAKYILGRISLNKVMENFVVRLGSLSFGVYLIHVIILEFIVKLTRDNIVLDTTLIRFGVVIIEIVGTFIISYLSVYLISKIKYLKKII